MKFILLRLQCISFLAVVVVVHTKVYLREQSPTSPAAINSGILCIHRLSDIYFHNVLSSQVPNMAYMHTETLSSPAKEIEEGALQMMHRRVLEDEMPVKFQLRVYSANPRLPKFRRPHIITPLNFYVIVIDTYETVSTKF